MTMRLGWFALSVLLLPALAAAQDAPDPQLAKQGYQILKTYCNRCHGVKFEVEGFNVLRRDILIDPDNAYVVLENGAGNLDDSNLWQRVGVEKDMPPEGAPRPSEAELAVLKDWLLAGAPFPDAETRPFITEREMLQSIRDDLASAAKADRRFFRYFTITNLFNNSAVDRVGRNGKPVDAADLQLARTALAKLVNSLSWEKEIVPPKAVDPQQTVFRVDLRQLGWVEGNLWNQILSGASEDKPDADKESPYPYGLSYRVHKDPEVRKLAREITTATGNELPWIRADWFIDTASRPPLYHTMLRLPKTAKELEELLGVDVIDDFQKNKLARAGFAESGVSRQNRLVDRHSASFGAYWKSYDFGSSEGEANLFRFPLGPKFEGNKFEEHAFQHDGGEIIFNLPNGLQGYLLIDAKGDRINTGPIQIVRDLKESGGTAEVVNGLSCMSCHDRGVKPFKDTIRQGLALSGAVRLKVEKLFPSSEVMALLLKEDEDRFMTALATATAPFVKNEDDAEGAADSSREPIGEIARLYQKDLELEEAAAELGFTDAKQLQAAIQGNPRLRALGLGPLVQGAAIKRSVWSSTLNFLSPFHQTALELDRGTPHREL